MKRTLRIALISALVFTAACHRDNKDAQLKALDKAYLAGVFTREEYEAKKAALLGAPAAATPPPASTPAPPADGSALPAPTADPSQMAAPPPDSSGGVSPNSPMAAAPQAAQSAPAPAAAPPAAPVARRAAEPAASAPAPAASQAPPTNGAFPSPVQQQMPPQQPMQQQLPPAQPTPQTQAAPPMQSAEAEPAPLAGCKDAESRAGGPKGVLERFFPASEQAVRGAASVALGSLDFTIRRDAAHELEANRRGRLNTVAGGGEERLILHFSSAQQGGVRGTLVRGETKTGILGKLTQKPWTSAVMAQISCNLKR